MNIESHRADQRRGNSICSMLAVGLVTAVLSMPLVINAKTRMTAIVDQSTMDSAVAQANLHLGSSDGVDVNVTREMRIRQENLRKQQRKERMAADTNRLLELTKQLQTDIATHPQLTPDDAKKLDDIAKLAREVKSRMVE